MASVIVRDASFETRQVPWSPTQGVQVLDFTLEHGEGFTGTCLARSTLYVRESGDFSFGVAGAGTLRLWLDDQLQLTTIFPEPSQPTEYAYNRFRWPTRFSLRLDAGVHRILLAVQPGHHGGRAFLQASDAHGAEDGRLSFGTDTTSGPAQDWQISGPWPEALDTRPILPVTVDAPAAWHQPRRSPVEDFVVNPSAVFRQHSLVEWHYANGVTHLALLELADTTHDVEVRQQVDRLVGFTLDRLPLHRRQFETLHAWRGANYRLFRGCLLDDTSAPALPMIELARRGQLSDAAPVLEQILDFVLRRNPRLADGTLCRDEPEPQTVWADDLFMSTTFLARAAAWKNDPQLLDECTRQVQLFHRHLLDRATGHYWHGYVATRDTHAGLHWGRANGWIAWATSEVLRMLPADHRDRSALIAAQRRHLEALLPLQAASGLWHQILDQPSTYEETSASAMFLIAICRGVEGGWLDRDAFAPAARRAWAGLRNRIDENGVVHGICRGTEIGDTLEFYASRPTKPHDPRGLGAVITAAVAMDRVFASSAR
ncbi:MAG: glycoside hydrolase family 88 protein [Opitutaceae bacterium]|nr:glycoside hydrolase family 88 protein [Opitutaceae bacterium]